MDTVPNFTIYNLPPSPPKWDNIGIFFICFCVIWTSLVFAGMAFCWFNRHNPVLKIRGLPLSFTAILFLHAYWVLAQLVYPIGGTMPVVLAYDIQYFFMSIWFPLGIALFHASNSRFLYVAKLQKQFTNNHRIQVRCNGGGTSWLCRFRNMSYTVRIMSFIGLGMVAQVLLAIGMWLACRKYHPTFGIPGTEIRGATLVEQMIDLGRGWEWWPSVVWQVIWTWMVAPYLIWHAWGIRDTMGWRAQTIGCCISNLHATPMFLIAQYVPAFEPVNMYFPPSQWIHLSVMMFEIFTVFVPVFQVIKLNIQCRKVAASNQKWESSSQITMFGSSQSSDQERKGSTSSRGKSDIMDNLLINEMSDHLYTIGALDYVLRENPTPLQNFSALSDFSGENIAFLTRAATWKNTFSGGFRGEKELDAYNAALQLYTDFISPRDAEFPLNLSGPELRRLEDIFEAPTRILCGEPVVITATPFDIEQPQPPGSSGGCSSGGNSTTPILRAKYTGEIPPGFDGLVFDSTCSHIKYLVLTNTWPKFVDDMRNQSRRSSESGRTFDSNDSDQTLASRVSTYVRSMF
ncbi:unnamed protein product [Clonostachys solani]|uniref:RGS domain-containing protein n=1 Tax=Clonostachys solani TaxID=160281 RepID=A0A9N9ZCR6_9HYPO|nr:unnamed protein product [Clonostachys solani]